MDLVPESADESLRDAVRAIGGSAVVGHKLWSLKPIREAENRCNNCINPEREEKFSLIELLWILREARQVGFHGFQHYINRDGGYQEAIPLEPEDEQSALQRAYIESVKEQRRIADEQRRISSKLERLQFPNLKSVG